MKNHQLLFLFVALALIASLAAACSSANPTTAPVKTNPPANAGQNSGGSYPGPTEPPAAEVSSYPAPAAGAAPQEIDWKTAERKILDGDIATITQTKSNLEVLIATKTGELFKTTEPAFDEVTKVIQTCGEPCKVIKVTNQ